MVVVTKPRAPASRPSTAASGTLVIPSPQLLLLLYVLALSVPVVAREGTSTAVPIYAQVACCGRCGVALVRLVLLTFRAVSISSMPDDVEPRAEPIAKEIAEFGLGM